MSGPWEDRLLLDYSVAIEPVTENWRKDAKPHQVGFAGLWPLGAEGTRVVLWARPELTPEQREGFSEWCWQRIGRYLEHGPELDGWQERSDGGWQLYVAEHALPDMRFLDDAAP